MRRYEGVRKGAAAMRKNVGRVEQCCQEFGDLLLGYINYLTEYRSQWLQRMDTEKDDFLVAIEAAVQETTVCLDQGTLPTSSLGQSLWALSAGELQQVCAVSPPDLQALCETWTSIESQLRSLCERFNVKSTEVKNLQKQAEISTPPELQKSKYVAIYMKSLETFDLRTQETTRQELSVNFNIGGSYIELDNDTWLCVGGQPASNAVHSLNLSSIKLTALPHLLAQRCGAGIAKDAESVYVFGGWNSSCLAQTSCEKYRDRVWQALPKMNHARWSFTPCAYKGLIYLACPASPVESFSPPTEKFTLLNLVLPFQKIVCSVAFVANGELCVLTQDKHLARWRIEGETEFRCSAVEKGCWSTQPPLVVDSLVLVACEGKVMKLSLETFGFL